MQLEDGLTEQQCIRALEWAGISGPDNPEAMAYLADIGHFISFVHHHGIAEWYESLRTDGASETEAMEETDDYLRAVQHTLGPGVSRAWFEMHVYGGTGKCN